MGSYMKVLMRAGPIVLPLLVAGVRHLMRKKQRDNEPQDGTAESQESAVGDLVDIGLSALTRGRGKRSK